MSRGGLVSFSTFNRPEDRKYPHPSPYNNGGFPHSWDAAALPPVARIRHLLVCNTLQLSSEVRMVCLSPKKGTRLTLDNQRDRVLSANSRGCSSSGSSPSSSAEHRAKLFRSSPPQSELTERTPASGQDASPTSP